MWIFFWNAIPAIVLKSLCAKLLFYTVGYTPPIMCQAYSSPFQPFPVWFKFIGKYSGLVGSKPTYMETNAHFLKGFPNSVWLIFIFVIVFANISPNIHICIQTCHFLSPQIYSYLYLPFLYQPKYVCIHICINCIIWHIYALFFLTFIVLISNGTLILGLVRDKYLCLYFVFANNSRNIWICIQIRQFLFTQIYL